MYPRLLRERVEEALDDSPMVLIHSPRQCGKTTLARQVGDALGFAHFSFDGDVQREATGRDPVGYVADLPDRVVLDEAASRPDLVAKNASVTEPATLSDTPEGRFASCPIK